MANYAPCNGWELRRNDHLPSMVIVRREGFANDQWPLAGSSLLTEHYVEAGWQGHDPAQIVRPDARCRYEGRPVAEALAQLPREAFDFLWLIDVPPVAPALLDGWRPVWAGEGSALYARDVTKPVGAKRRPRTPRPETLPARSGVALLKTPPPARG